MIRVLVLVLAAANLFYWGWSRWVSEESPRLIAPGTATAAAASPVTPAAQAPCTRVGPIAEEVEAMAIEQLLRDMRLQPLRRTVTADVREGWWVYVANADAATQARTLRTIQGAGIDDASAMRDDPEFRVSVGLFIDQSRAERRAGAVRALRLEPVVAERMKQATSTWFEMPGIAPSAVDRTQLAAEGVDTAVLEIRECPDDVSIETILPPAPTGATSSEGAERATV